MLQIDDKIVSDELFTECFCCNYEQCKGICCIEGEGGAPLSEGELEQIEANLSAVWPLLLPKSKTIIETEGVSYVDEEGDVAINIVDGGHCVFATFDDEGNCLCSFEKLYREGKISFLKPQSCYLYPIRLQQYPTFTAVNYNRWSICRGAVKKGRKMGLPIYKFLKDPLIRAFGEDWYRQLSEQAEPYCRYLRERGLL